MIIEYLVKIAGIKSEYQIVLVRIRLLVRKEDLGNIRMTQVFKEFKYVLLVLRPFASVMLVACE